MVDESTLINHRDYFRNLLRVLALFIAYTELVDACGFIGQRLREKKLALAGASAFACGSVWQSFRMCFGRIIDVLAKPSKSSGETF